MLSTVRRGFVNTRVSTVAYRSYSRSTARLGGAAHGDDHEHHEHPLWENLPFGKNSTGGMLLFFLVGGVGAIWGSCVHQNKKHGFYEKK